jgi:hypothetical protein
LPQRRARAPERPYQAPNREVHKIAVFVTRRNDDRSLAASRIAHVAGEFEASAGQEAHGGAFERVKQTAPACAVAVNAKRKKFRVSALMQHDRQAIEQRALARFNPMPSNRGSSGASASASLLS